MANKKKKSKKVNDRKLQMEQNKRLWRELFELVGQIFALHPWEHFQSGNVFALAPGGNADAVFFDIEHDRLLHTRSLTIYPSRKDYVRFLNASQGSSREQARQQIEQARCTLFLGAREQLPEQMLSCIKKVGVTFGSGLWPWIEYKPHGCAPILPDETALRWILDMLGHFRMQLHAVVEQKQRIDFANGEMLLRVYNPSHKVWMNMTAPFVLPPVQPPVPLCTDAAQLTALADCPRAEQVERIEFDYGWLTEPVCDQAGDIPYYPMLLVFTDRVSHQTLAHVRCHPDAFRAQVFSVWCDLLEQYGRPETLYVSREENMELFLDFANQTRIALKQVKRLPAAEKVLRDAQAI